MAGWERAARELVDFVCRSRKCCEAVDLDSNPPEWLDQREAWKWAGHQRKRAVLSRLCEASKLNRAFESYKARTEQLRLRAKVQREMGLHDLSDTTLNWAERFWQRALRAAVLAFERETRAERAFEKIASDYALSSANG